MPFTCFAYGSNMFLLKMKKPAPSAQFKIVGRLPGYVLRFNKESKDDGSGKGNIVATGNTTDEVWGVIYEIADRDRKPLDHSEGGYDAIMVEILTATGRLSVLTYVAKPNRVSDSLKPYTWYKEFIVRGAKEHGLPAAYIQALETIEAMKDPDQPREQKNLDLLGATFAPNALRRAPS